MLKGTLHKSIVWLLVGLFSLPAFATENVNITVQEVQGVGLTVEQRQELSNLIANYLSNEAHLSTQTTWGNNEVTSTCLKEGSCKETNGGQGSSHLLVSSVNALGSTFVVTLKLHNLQQNAALPLVVAEEGKRASTTFSEATLRALAQVVQLGHLGNTTVLASAPVASTATTIPIMVAQTATPTNSVVAKEKSKDNNKVWIWAVVGALVAGGSALAIMAIGDGGGTNQVGAANQASTSAHQPIPIGASVTIR